MVAVDVEDGAVEARMETLGAERKRRSMAAECVRCRKRGEVSYELSNVRSLKGWTNREMRLWPVVYSRGFGRADYDAAKVVFQKNVVVKRQLDPEQMLRAAILSQKQFSMAPSRATNQRNAKTDCNWPRLSASNSRSRSMLPPAFDDSR